MSLKLYDFPAWHLAFTLLVHLVTERASAKVVLIKGEKTTAGIYHAARGIDATKVIRIPDPVLVRAMAPAIFMQLSERCKQTPTAGLGGTEVQFIPRQSTLYLFFLAREKLARDTA